MTSAGLFEADVLGRTTTEAWATSLTEGRESEASFQAESMLLPCVRADVRTSGPVAAGVAASQEDTFWEGGGAFGVVAELGNGRKVQA